MTHKDSTMTRKRHGKKRARTNIITIGLVPFPLSSQSQDHGAAAGAASGDEDRSGRTPQMSTAYEREPGPELELVEPETGPDAEDFWSSVTFCVLGQRVRVLFFLCCFLFLSPFLYHDPTVFFGLSNLPLPFPSIFQAHLCLFSSSYQICAHSTPSHRFVF